MSLLCVYVVTILTKISHLIVIWNLLVSFFYKGSIYLQVSSINNTTLHLQQFNQSLQFYLPPTIVDGFQQIITLHEISWILRHFDFLQSCRRLSLSMIYDTQKILHLRIDNFSVRYLSHSWYVCLCLIQQGEYVALGIFSYLEIVWLQESIIILDPRRK